MELSIEHISKQFKDTRAVDDVSLLITPGVWGLLGANGFVSSQPHFDASDADDRRHYEALCRNNPV